MAYIEAAERLAARVLRLAMGMPKRYARMMGDPIYSHAEAVLFHAKAANLVRVTDADSLARRRGHLGEAQAHLLHVETMLDVYARTRTQLSALGECRPLASGTYRELAEMLAMERRLLAGVRRRDTLAYNESVKREAAGCRDDLPAGGVGPPTTGGSAPSTPRRTSASSTTTAT